MKKYLLIAVIAVLAYGYIQERNITFPFFSSRSQIDDSVLKQAYNHRQKDLQIRGEGVVIKILPDDREGSRHQRFILRLSSGQTLMVAHNIDLAPRISSLNKGDKVEFYGEYDWNAKGGVIHWTHHDPSGGHVGGWVRHDGKTYK